MSKIKNWYISLKKVIFRIGYMCVFFLPVTHCKFFPWGGILRRFFAKGFISCGNNVNIERGARFSSKVSLGDYSGIGVNATINGHVIIGKFVMTGPDLLIIHRNHSCSRIDIPMIFQGYTDEKTVIIEDDVWIGARVTILPGVKIGQGAVVGAGSVVTKDVEPYAIVAGNPATFIRSRKPEIGPSNS